MTIDSINKLRLDQVLRSLQRLLKQKVDVFLIPGQVKFLRNSLNNVVFFYVNARAYILCILCFIIYMYILVEVPVL